MKKKGIFRAISAGMAAVMVLSSAPVTAPAVAAETETQEAADDLKIWFDQPASKGTTILSAGSGDAEDNQWQQFTLPIGNSFMGANVYGEIAEEWLTFNHKTLWNGGPSESRPNYNGGNKETASDGSKMVDKYHEVVDALKNGTHTDALSNQLVGEGSGDGYGAYQSWGDIKIRYDGLTSTTETTGYERNLDLSTAIANVDFNADSTQYHREFFVSYPDDVLAMKLTAEGKNDMNLNVRFPIDNADTVVARKLGKTGTYTVDAQNKTIICAGSMQDNQLKLNSNLQVVTKGKVTAGEDGESLDIAGANEVIIFVSADTDYKNEYPSYRTGETDEQLEASVADTVSKAVAKGYEKVKEAHLKDYQELFGRLDLNLGQTASDKPTDELLAAYNNKKYKKNEGTEAVDVEASYGEKRLLEVLLYQYGRYMTIASSREGDLPSNLQGVWQNRVGNGSEVPWGCDYHMNVNLQMNYWPTYSANLAECAIPLIDYVESLRKPGRETARIYFGIESKDGEENGFTAHTQNTPFGWTCPGWDFSWGWSPAAVPWILQNCWEYYEYTGDKEFMEERLYPMMKEEARLYDQILVDSEVEITMEDGTKSTRLVSAPAYSPEQGPRTLGNVYEQTLIWQLYEDTITAAETLGKDEELVKTWKANQSRLAPIEVGESNQIKEWYHETTLGSVGSTGHRHMSHLLGLFPGDLISVDNDEYMEAAIVSLKDRGLKTTGWGMGQRINTWARTGDGDTSYQVIKTLFNDGIYPNLFDTHSPFQIDGNFGYTSGVDEMLMQSNMGYINVLPALPGAWEDGSVEGIVARGNFEVDIAWEEGTATEVKILSNNGEKCIVQYPLIRSAIVRDSGGNQIYPEVLTKNRISFDTRKGETYTISSFEATKEAEESVRKGRWTAVAGSQKNKDNDGPASWAIDGSTSSWWHSDYGDDADTPVISENGERNDYTIDFGKTIPVAIFEYVPRDVDKANGTITKCNIYYSTTGQGDNFIPLKEGQRWAYDTTAKRVDFGDNIEMRRLKIVVTETNEGGNTYISAAEFNVYTKNTIVEPDDSGLRKFVDEAKKLVPEDYPKQSADAFGEALEMAETVLGYGDASQKELDQTLERLSTARTNLVAEGKAQNTQKLEEKVQSVDKLNEDQYSPETLTRFKNALEQAKKLLEDKNATPEALAAALRELEAARNALKVKAPVPPVSPVPAKGSKFDDGSLQYMVVQSAAVNGTVTVVRQINKKKAAVVIPDTVVKDGYTFKVVQVAAKVFQKNKKIKSVTFGANVTNIGAKSFLKCSKLKKITFKSVKAPKIGSQAFKGIKAKCAVTAPKKMASKQFKLLKKRMKSAGKKVKYKKK